MKSFVCIMMGIAVIAFVVPVECLLAQTVLKQRDSYCDTTYPHVQEYPEDVFCDPSKSACNENTKIYHQPVQKCVSNETEYSGDCDHWMGPAQYRSYPIIAEGQDEFDAAVLDVAVSGVVGCTLYGVVATGATGGNVFAGIVASILCGGVMYVASLTLNLCAYGGCKADWTREKIGPNRFRCY